MCPAESNWLHRPITDTELYNLSVKIRWRKALFLIFSLTSHLRVAVNSVGYCIKAMARNWTYKALLLAMLTLVRNNRILFQKCIIQAIHMHNVLFPEIHLSHLSKKGHFSYNFICFQVASFSCVVQNKKLPLMFPITWVEKSQPAKCLRIVLYLQWI